MSSHMALDFLAFKKCDINERIGIKFSIASSEPKWTIQTSIVPNYVIVTDEKHLQLIQWNVTRLGVSLVSLARWKFDVIRFYSSTVSRSECTFWVDNIGYNISLLNLLKTNEKLWKKEWRSCFKEGQWEKCCGRKEQGIVWETSVKQKHFVWQT